MSLSLLLAVLRILVNIILIIKTANLQLCGDCVTRMTGKFSSTMDTKTDFNLNNIIATLSVSFFGKNSRGQMSSKCRLLLETLLVFHCLINTTAINRK